MRLSPRPLEISDNEGFTKEKDIFKRENFGKGLTNIIIKIDHPLVIALDAQWGSGKSTFLRMWSGDLKQNGIGVIYFDAFAHDYLDDPFSALAGQIISLAKSKDKENDNRLRDFQDRAITVGKIVARSSIKVAAALATGGVLNAEGMTEASKVISTEAASVTDKYFGEMITKQKEQKEAIDEFKISLSKLPELLADGSQINEANKPIVIIVDELDRCRPSFAFEMLEKIKHFFSVTNVHFFLGVHLTQLENSAKATYGSDIDGKMYLQKFISLTVSFPAIPDNNFGSASSIYTKYLAKEFGIPDKDGEFYAWLVSRIAKHNNYSLRTIEKIFTHIALAYIFNAPNTMRPEAIIAGLCVLKVVAPDLYMKAKDNELRYNEILNILSTERKIPGETYDIDAVRDMWKYALMDHTLASDREAQIARLFFKYTVHDRERFFPTMMNYVIDNYKLAE